LTSQLITNLASKHQLVVRQVKKSAWHKEPWHSMQETFEAFLRKLHLVIEKKGLKPEQIYNADETGLLWKFLS